MRPITALLLSLLAGASTFTAQHYFFPARLHAAPFAVPTGSEWRQQMIDSDPGGAVVDQQLDHLAMRLDLSADQITEFRPVLERQHERILALLVAGPASLTRDQFMAEREALRQQTHRQLEALLTPEQLEIVKELGRPANS